VAGFWAMLTAYHSVALLLHSCTVQNTEKGISIKVEKLQTYVKVQNKKVQSGIEMNQDTKKGVTKLDLSFFAGSVSNSD
jgi:hypothetical protein